MMIGMMQQPEKMMHAPSPNYYKLRKSSSHENPNHLIIKTCALSIIRVAHVDIGSVIKKQDHCSFDDVLKNIIVAQEDPLTKELATGEESKNLELYYSVQRKDYHKFYQLPMKKVLRETWIYLNNNNQNDVSTSTDEDKYELFIFETSEDYIVHL
jgi:hypothetical protein